MGTTSNNKPDNRVTISRGGNVPSRKVNPETGKTDRSFAQPNPAVEHPQINPKAHASEDAARKALEANSKMGKTYDEDGSADGDSSQA